MTTKARLERHVARPAGGMSVALAVADDDLRRRLAAILAQHGVLLARAAANLGALIASPPLAVDAVVLDERDRRAGQIGADVQAAKRALGAARLVLICSARRRTGARAAVQAGADAVLVEYDLESALLPAVRATYADQVVISAPLARGALLAGAVTYRERQVLGMVVMGFSNYQISQKLCLAESSVKGHLSSAFAKLDVSSRSEAASLILDPHNEIGAGILGISTADGAA
jgi:DNA-binding NarL/FixJ family response regulator